MNFNHIKTIIDKEWAEVFKNRMVIFTIAFMPVMFTVLPLVMLNVMSSTTSSATSASGADVPAAFLAVCGNASATGCMQIYLMNQFLMLFMMMPLVIPTAIAAYSIVGEKTTRSLEPLLATPLRTTELLWGKALAAALPAVVITWVCFGIFLLLMPLVGGTPELVRYVLGPTWMMAVIIIGPLMAIAAVNLAVIVSSRVNDPRVAEQVAGVLVVPVIAMMFAQIAGLITLNVTVMLISILVMLIVDIALVYFGARLFQRETILTRWR